MALKTYEQMATEIMDAFVDNSEGQITPKVLRDRMLDILDSVVAGPVGGPGPPGAIALGNVYPNTISGLTAVAEGEYFSVPSTEPGEAFIVYQDVAGSAVEVTRIPSATTAANGVTPGNTMLNTSLLNVTKLPSSLTSFTRGGSRGYFNAAGLFVTAPANVPAFTYKPSVAVNLLGANAQYPGGAGWTNTAVSQGATITTPDGSTLPKLIESNGSNVFYTTFPFTPAAAGLHMAAFVVKPAERTQGVIRVGGVSAVFNLIGGGSLAATNSLGQIRALHGAWEGWYVIGLLWKAPNTSATTVDFGLAANGEFNSYMGVAGYGAYVYRAQVESGGVLNCPVAEYQGLLYEPATYRINTTNQRNLANGEWVKTNATCVRDQVGIDGVANAASSMLAMAANATVAYTAAWNGAGPRIMSMYVRRLIGGGPVSISPDGVNFTTVDVGRGAYVDVHSAAQDVTGGAPNAILTIKLAASGDKIAVDFVQGEASTRWTSPLPDGANQRLAETMQATLPAGTQNLVLTTDLAAEVIPQFGGEGGTLVVPYAARGTLTHIGTSTAQMGLVASGSVFPDSLANGLAYLSSRSRHYSPEPIKWIKAAFANWAVSNAYGMVETGSGYPLYIKASIEDAQGRIYPMSFGGVDQGVIPDATTGWTDLTKVDISGYFYLRTMIYTNNGSGPVPASYEFFIDQLHGEGCTTYSSDDDTTKSPGLPSGPNYTTTMSPWLHRPIALVGLTARETYATMGDSRTRGVQDDPSDGIGDRGQVGRALTATRAHINAGIGFDRAFGVVASHALRQPIIALATNLSIAYGTNDLSLSRTPEQVIADFDTIAALFPKMHKVVYCTMPPWGVDGTYDTLAGQTVNTSFDAKRTALNNLIKAKAGVQIWDIASAVEEPTAPGKWRVDKGVLTADGGHENATANRLIAASGVITP